MQVEARLELSLTLKCMIYSVDWYLKLITNDSFIRGMLILSTSQCQALR